jgi:hypothetical protein
LDKEWARLRKLEEQAREQHGRAGDRRERPNDTDERQALQRGYAAWRELMHRHGWTDAQIDEEERWAELVNQRCDEADYESWQEPRYVRVCRVVEPPD